MIKKIRTMNLNQIKQRLISLSNKLQRLAQLKIISKIRINRISKFYF